MYSLKFDHPLPFLEMIDMKKENQRLYQRIDELKQTQGSLQAQVEKLQEELAGEYLRYRYVNSSTENMYYNSYLCELKIVITSHSQCFTVYNLFSPKLFFMSILYLNLELNINQ